MLAQDGTAAMAPVIPIARWIDTPPAAHGAHLCRDGKTLLMAFSKYPEPSVVMMFDVASGKTLRTIESPGPNWDFKGLAVSADERFLYVSNYYRRHISRIDLHDNNRWTNLLIAGVPEAVWAGRMALTPDHRKLVVCVGQDGRAEDLDNDQISIVDVSEGGFSLVGEVRLDDEISAPMAFSADSKFVYVVTRQRKSPAPTLYEIRLTEPFAVTRRLGFPDTQLQGVAISNRLQRLFVSHVGKRRIEVVDLKSFKPASSFQLNGYAPGYLLAHEPDNSLYVLSPESRKLFILDATDGTLRGRVDGLRQSAAGIQVLPENRGLLVWHTETGQGVAVIPFLAQKGGLVFASNRGGEGYQIYRLAFGEEEAVRLTYNHAADRCPRWSPDGRRIAYVSTAPGLPRICITDGKGSPPTVLDGTDAVVPHSAAALDWSPDGKEIVFIGKEGRAIRIVEPATGKVRTLVDGEIGDRCGFHLGVDWRRADGRILVSSQSPGSADEQGVFLLDAQTGQVTQVMSSGGHWDFLVAAVSSPDGRRIAALRPGGMHQPPDKVYLAEADGKAPSCLVDVKTEYQRALRWSLDGRHLLYAAAIEGRYHIFVVDVARKKSLQLTRGDCDDIEPDIHGAFEAP